MLPVEVFFNESLDEYLEKGKQIRKQISGEISEEKNPGETLLEKNSMGILKKFIAKFFRKILGEMFQYHSRRIF